MPERKRRRTGPSKSRYTPEQIQGFRERDEAALREIHEKLTDAWETTVNGDTFKQMLRLSAAMPSYSANNLLLVMIQRPQARLVMGLGAWHKLGHRVKDEEFKNPILILAPAERRTVTVEDKDTGEEKTVQKAPRYFKPVKVYSDDQIEGPLPDLSPTLLTGEAPREIWEGLVTHLDAKGYQVRLEEPHTPGANGETSPAEMVVRIHPDREPMQQLKTLAHEVAHVDLGHVDNTHRGMQEVETESMAFVFLAAMGIDSEPYSVNYIAGWSGGKADVLRATADNAIKGARELLKEFDRVPELEAETGAIDLEAAERPTLALIRGGLS